MTIFYCVILFLLGIGFLWRFASRRIVLPCPTWLGFMVEMDNPFTKTNRAHFIIEHLDVQPGMTVLDAGCGPGRLTIPLAQKVCQQGTVCAMDIQQGMLERVEGKARAAHLNNVIFLHAGLGEGKLAQAHFDRAVLVTVLGEIPNQTAALQELFDALKLGGVLAVVEVIFDPHFQRRSVVRQLALAVGFKEKATSRSWYAYCMLLEKPATTTYQTR